MALDLGELKKQYESTLLERMGHALGSLGREEEAVVAIDQSIQALTQSGTSEN